MISVCMITRTDDLHYIANTVSTCPVGSEIVIVETIRGEHESFEMVHETEHIKHWRLVYVGDFHFANARNKALSLCTNPWVLSLDTDDALSDLERRWIQEVLPEVDEKIGAIMCMCSGILNFDGYDIDDMCEVPGLPVGSHGYWLVPTVRLFRNGKHLKWIGRIHEQILGSIIDAGYGLMISDLNIRHRGYRCTIDEYIQKMERNLKLLHMQLDESEDYVSEYRSYLQATQATLDGLYDYKKMQEQSALDLAATKMILNQNGK